MSRDDRIAFVGCPLNFVMDYVAIGHHFRHRVVTTNHKAHGRIQDSEMLAKAELLM
jgi:hypothetical protein